MASVRAELLAFFSHILLGDALAAEYLVLHLISDVYAALKLHKVLPSMCPQSTLEDDDTLPLPAPLLLAGTAGGTSSRWGSLR